MWSAVCTIVALAAASRGSDAGVQVTPRPLGDVVIVGAGASGIATAKAFHRRGCRSLTILDKASTVGGHWAWQPNYVGVGVQNKRDAYRYSDAPMEGSGPRASAAECVDYLAACVARHGLSDSLRLGQEVVGVVASRRARHDSGGRRPRQTLRVRDVATGGQSTLSADVVVLAAGITPFIPPVAAASTAPGTRRAPLVRHSSQLDASLIQTAIDGRWRVVVIGGGKSACECVAALRDGGHPASLLHCVASSPSTCAVFEPQLWPRAVQRLVLALFALSTRLAAANSQLCQLLARAARWPLFWVGVLASSPVGGGCWRTLNGQVLTRHLLRRMRGVAMTRGRMEGLGEACVLCSGGEEVPAELVVCATGFRIACPPLYIDETGEAAEAEAAASVEEGSGGGGGEEPRRPPRRCDLEREMPLLYRSMVLPETPRVAAILYNSMGINAMFSAELMAEWLAHFYASARADDADLRPLVAADAAPLRELGGGEPFNNWHFWRSGETAGGRGYASDYYEEQIYADLNMEMPSRRLALLRLQHDESYYAEAAASFEALAAAVPPAAAPQRHDS